MSKRCYMFFILIALTTTSLSAFHITGSLSSGASYDSNVQYLYLLEKVTNSDWKQKDTAFLTTNGDISLYPLQSDSFSIDFALLSSLSLPDPSFSRLNFYTSLYYAPDLTESLSLISMVQLHHLMENYTALEQMYIDVHASLILVWMASESFDIAFETKGAYYHSFSDRIPELKGPTVGETISLNYYLGNQGSMISLLTGINYQHFRDYDSITHCTNSYAIVSRYLSLPQELKVRFVKEWFSLTILFKYSYLYWLGFDEWIIPDGSFKKRRKDHVVAIVPSISFQLPAEFRINVTYLFDNTLSNMGEYQYDYVDYRVMEHTVKMEIEWSFSTKK